MNVSRRRYMGAKGGGTLPSGYTQVEYIENTSNAYIDTGVKATNTTQLSLIVQDSGSGAFRTYLGCSGLVSLSGAKFIRIKYVVNKTQATWGSTTYEYGFFSLSTKSTINIYGNVIEFVIGTSTYTHTFTDDTFTTSGNILFLASSQNSSIDGYTAGKIYGATIDNVRNFVPCISPNNVVGLYDTIGNQFYSSPNGTAFIAGNPV